MPNLSKPFSVIFDMDGVLIDSYHAHFKTWQMTAKEAGEWTTEEQFQQIFGRTSREAIATLWGSHRFSPEEIAAWDRRKEAAFRRAIADDCPFMPGAMELIELLHKRGISLAVGSSAPPENVDLVLDKMGNRDQFSAVVTGADVERGKPDPQVFLVAAARMNTAPAQCVVIEDAALGVEAAHAAGMAAIGLASTGRTRESLVAADLVVDTFHELTPEIIEGVIRKRHQHQPIK